MKDIYKNIVEAKASHQKLLAVLLDPDKIDWVHFGTLVSKIKASPATHILVGGSLVVSDNMSQLVAKLKEHCHVPIILFPGNPSQLSPDADGILFLSLLSGRNPDYLIGHQVKAAPVLKLTQLEVIPTGYILVESGATTAVEKVSETTPMSVNDPEAILHTAQAGEMLGKKLIYLEAGSGAQQPVPAEIIKHVADNIGIPLIVGGGIRDSKGIQKAYDCGADMVVIGTAFENNLNFFDDPDA